MDEFWFQIVAEGDGPPPEIRLRKLLKDMLRGYGLRCLSYGLVPEGKRKASRRRQQNNNAGNGPAEQENR